MKMRMAALALPLALGLGGCSDAPSGPEAQRNATPLLAVKKGTGIVLDIIPNVSLPLGLGGSITIDQAVLTNFAVVENAAGAIVGLEVTGTLTGTAVDVAGGLVAVNAVPFVANIAVTSQGPGQCSAVTLDLSAINIEGLGLVTGHVPVNLDVKGSGAVGSLLCNIGSLVGGIGGLIGALNNQI